MLSKLQLFAFCLFAGVLLPIGAQSVITIEKTGMIISTGALDGKGRIVFKSQSSELVITSSVKEDPACDEPVKVRNGYEYRMACDISNGSDKRVFTIAFKGTTITEKTGQVQLFQDKIACFNVELVENPITMELAPDGSHFVGEGNGWALIEFNSETPLTVKFDKALQGKLKSGRSKAGIYVDSLIINVESINRLDSALKVYKTRIDSLEKCYDDTLKTATDGCLDTLRTKIDSLEEIRVQNEDQLFEVTRISIKGDDTNERVVDPDAVRNLASKGKLRYNVVLLTKTKTVFKTRYEEMVHQAESHKHTRDYASAKRFYESAAEAEGATDADKQTALECAQKMGKLANVKAETDEKADQLYEISASNKVVNKTALFKLIDEIAMHYDALYQETGETYYKDEASRLRAQKEKVGFVFKGKCVTSDYKGGRLVEEPLPGVRIYGSDKSNCEAMNKTDYPFKGEFICESAADGSYSFSIQEGKYKTIIFSAPAKSKFKKNKHVGLEGRTGDRNVKVRFSKD